MIKYPKKSIYVETIFQMMYRSLSI